MIVGLLSNFRAHLSFVLLPADAGAQCLPGDQTKPPVCKCSPGFVGAECITAADQSGKIIKDEEKYLDDLKRQQFLANQVPSPNAIVMFIGIVSSAHPCF